MCDELNKKELNLTQFDGVLKSFNSIIGTILEPRGIDLIVLEGHKKVIEKVIENKDVDEDMVAFVCGYKHLIREYQNCRNVAENAKRYLKESAKPQNIDVDWLNFYFDKVRLVSDEIVQDIWSRILAEEANAQGSVSLSLLHTLSIMSKEQATIFSNIARFCMREYQGEKVHSLIFLSTNVEAYSKSRINHKNLRALERLGLIDYNAKDEYVFHKKKVLASGNRLLTIYGDPDNKNKIKAGNVIFTEDGMKLYSIVSDTLDKYRTDITDFTIARFKARNCKVFINGKEV